MKKYSNIIYSFFTLLVGIALMVSCETSEVSGSNPPVIESVSVAIEDTITDIGFADNTYLIRGKNFSTLNKIYFNNFETYFNPTYVTDNVVFVTIDKDTPTELENEAITFVTDYGTGEFPFNVSAPLLPELNFILFDDLLQPEWWIGGWGGTQDFENPDPVKEGVRSIKRVTDPWSGFQVGRWGNPIPNLGDYEKILLFVYPENDGRVNVAINGDYGVPNAQINVTAGEWNLISIPLPSNIGGSDTLNEFVIQEASGISNVLYFDYIGLQ